MQPNILLVILDSVRARNTSLHGHANDTTPFLQDFAEDATVYTQARAPSTWSLPSHVSMFTGYHAEEHGITYENQRLVAGHTIWEELADEGYRTGVFSSNPFLTTTPVGLKDSFQTVVGQIDLLFADAADPKEFVRSEGKGNFRRYLRHALSHEKPLRSVANGVFEKVQRDHPALIPDSVWPQTTGWDYVDRFFDWSAETDTPWAACLNLMDAHHAYEPLEEHDNWGGAELKQLQREIDSYMWEFSGGQRPWWQRKALEGLYDGTIHQLDAQIRALIGELKNREVLDDTLVIITSDHGEGFGEPSHIRPDTRTVGHENGGIHDVLLHVPLLTRYPGQDTNRKIDAVVSLVELPSVIRDVVGGDATGEDFSTDDPVIASAAGLNERTQRTAEKYCESLWPYTATCRAVFESREDDRVQKYITWRDREAQVEIVDSQSSFKVSDGSDGVVEDAFETLRDPSVATEAGEVSARVQQRLEDLGYA